MYADFFGLSCRPFEILPDSKFLYLSSQHSLAVANIKFALLNRDSFVVITGEVGIGKTTILNSVFRALEHKIVLARLTHTTLEPVELLQAILVAFGQPVEGNSKVLLVEQLRLFLLEQYRAGKHVVIAVDEAQNLGMAALEELRLLTCIDADQSKLLTVALVGQPNLSDLIDSIRLRNLRQRTRLRQHLKNLGIEEAREYLSHRLAVAGGDFAALFEPGAAELVFEMTDGIPRMINTLCDTAMTAAAVRKQDVVTLECIREVGDELGWELPEHDSRHDTLVGDEPALILHKRGKHIATVALDADPFLIGRSASNHLALDDTSVSRRHALIFRHAEGWVIEDLGSTNGLGVNGEARKRHALERDDVLTIGVYRITFRDGQSDHAGTKPALAAVNVGRGSSARAANVDDAAEETVTFGFRIRKLLKDT